MAIWFGNPTIDDARASHVGLLPSSFRPFLWTRNIGTRVPSLLL
jgi:hypothetical protein